jgi:hypothetical protein
MKTKSNHKNTLGAIVSGKMPQENLTVQKREHAMRRYIESTFQPMSPVTVGPFMPRNAVTEIESIKFDQISNAFVTLSISFTVPRREVCE